MKQSFAVLLFLSVALVQVECYAHSLSNHIAQAKQVFNGYDQGRVSQDQEEVSFHRYYERFSFELDVNKKRDRDTLCWYIREELNVDSLRGNHRRYGHGWIMGKSFSDDIRKELDVRKELDKLYSDGKSKVIERVWSDKFCKRHYGYAKKLLGFKCVNEKVKAFSSIVHCVHLLGDREPGNKYVRFVLSVDELVKEISKQAKTLFEEKWSEDDNKRLKNAAIAGSEAQKAQAVLKAMIELKFGTKLHDKWGRQFENRPGCKWNPSVQSNSSSR